MALMILGLVLFLGIHSTSIVAEDFRNRMAAKSELGWKAFYGIVAIVGVVLIVKGYAAARMETAVLYTPPTFVKHIALTLMLPAFILFLAPYFPGRIKAWTKHPMLVSVKLWA
ncbi:MAG: NnrU family protein, partial [Gammaproteobacteria bacterium]|nr:NnrU family protein [Gammaproteobacteria bacterium]